MKNDEYMQSCFEMIAAIRNAVGVGITVMGVKTMMDGYDNDDDEAKRRGMQQILNGSRIVALPVFNNPDYYKWYFQEDSK